MPKSKDPEEQPLDIPGALLSIVGLALARVRDHRGAAQGLDARPAPSAPSPWPAVALGLFAVRELTARYPMLDLHLFKDRRFSVASAGMTLTFFAMFGTFFLVAQYFQLVLGYTPLAVRVCSSCPWPS